jgi:hypothetical protein
MDSLLQLSTVAFVGTLAWPVAYASGAGADWQRFHFVFVVWAWVILGGFALFLQLSPWLVAQALKPVTEQPLAWLALVAFLAGWIVAAWLWLAPERAEYRAMMRGGYAGLRQHEIQHGERGIDP